MARAQAFVFDAYGTLFDVHAVVTALQAVAPEAEAVSRQWRVKQLEYSWMSCRSPSRPTELTTSAVDVVSVGLTKGRGERGETDGPT
jgi:HAD superfamily hydrolase (TIGR01493 family)